nr:Calcineurin-like phosphoesterase [uncultured bacterium]
MKTFVVGDIHGRRAQLAALLQALPREEASDTLVFLGDLIDRGPDAPGVVSDVLELQRENPERVVTLRGNHEQMMLDFIDEDSRLWLSPVTGGDLWLSPVTGGDQTFQQYTLSHLRVETEEDFENIRRRIEESVPAEHLEFFRRMPLYHEDEYALYVHAGLDHGKHPRDTDAHQLLWTRDVEFYKKYRGKPCVFGHTPTAFPALARSPRASRHLHFTQRHRD